jgi:uncharacterized protein YkwD
MRRSIGTLAATAALAFPACALADAPAAPPAGPSTAADEARLRDGINAARAGAGLRALAPSPELTAAARDYARRIARTGRFAHAGNVTIPGFSLVGEVLARATGTPSPLAVVEQWLISPTHHRVITRASYRKIGIAVERADTPAGPVYVWVARLGQPTAAAARRATRAGRRSRYHRRARIRATAKRE